MIRHRVCALLLAFAGSCAHAQSSASQDANKLRQLSEAVEKQQKQIEDSQREINNLRRQIDELQQRLSASSSVAPSPQPPPTQQQAELDEIREHQQMNEEAIAVHEQTKVETASKYPLKVSGMVLLNGFINSKNSDSLIVPTLVTDGSGGAGFSLRQTSLGLEARGPSLWGAQSYGDIHVDFFGRIPQNSMNSVGGVLRMRTAHARLRWDHSELFASFDRPILAPHQPASLAQVATPALAWAGTLWSWFPQAGASHSFASATHGTFSIAGAFVDVLDPPLPNTAVINTSASERSRWLGAMGRLGWSAHDDNNSTQFGVGAYFSPHKSAAGESYNAWAVTSDWKLPLGSHLQFTGQAYRGRALGGLGEGVFKDYIEGSGETKGLDDVGGWAELKQRAGRRWEFNETYGIDNGFATTLRRYSSLLSGPAYMPLARNRMFFTNLFYRPSTYLQFSVEYRLIQSSPITGQTVNGHVGGVAAAYSF